MRYKEGEACDKWIFEKGLLSGIQQFKHQWWHQLMKTNCFKSTNGMNGHVITEDIQMVTNAGGCWRLLVREVHKQKLSHFTYFFFLSILLFPSSFWFTNCLNFLQLVWNPLCRSGMWWLLTLISFLLQF